MFDGGAKQFPHLVRYLNRFTSKRIGPKAEFSPFRVVLLILGLLGVNLIGNFVAGIGFATIALLYAAVVVFFLAQKPKVQLTPEEDFLIKAQGAARTMQECVDKRRLHRDLDKGSLSLLEECARHWDRVQTIFSSNYWNSEELPLHYRAAREQALKAADTGMAEIVVMYRPYLPEIVKGREAMDYVEEAVEKYVFKEGRDQRFPPPIFDSARNVAEKMRTLADEAEQLADQAQREQVIPTEALPGSALDLSIGELRSIRTAEDELRQNLRG